LEWFPGAFFLGAVLLVLIVPSFALIALAVVALAAVAALVALAGAILATPYLLVRTVRRRLAERHVPQPQPLATQPQPLPAAATFRAELPGPQVG
jgi:positive regulator of sigma E activity